MAAFDLKYLQNFLRRNWVLRQPLFFTYWLPKHPVFWLTPFSQHSQLDHFWLPTPDYAAPVWLTGRHATPLVTRCFPPQLLTPSLTLPWASARFLDPFYAFSLAHCRLASNSSPPNPCLGKQGISLGVAIILSMCLCSHTYLDPNQFTMILDLHLYISNCGYFCLWWNLW